MSLLFEVAGFSPEDQAGDGESGNDAGEGQANADGGKDWGDVVKFEILKKSWFAKIYCGGVEVHNDIGDWIIDFNYILNIFK